MDYGITAIPDELAEDIVGNYVLSFSPVLFSEEETYQIVIEAEGYDPATFEINGPIEIISPEPSELTIKKKSIENNQAIISWESPEIYEYVKVEATGGGYVAPEIIEYSYSIDPITNVITYEATIPYLFPNTFYNVFVDMGDSKVALPKAIGKIEINTPDSETYGVDFINSNTGEPIGSVTLSLFADEERQLRLTSPFNKDALIPGTYYYEIKKLPLGTGVAMGTFELVDQDVTVEVTFENE
ncbi:hypothetical protein SAMN04487944_11844 [Gracilibacillus ureilyticus]|uniref:Uncharacterized protein n=2 Tax=Gracilibacillus ureilyticus TaxID=531814 RepID=A0A1H9ULK1_9BACI|nr:hypothetical protein [Gracilibacillus ureilyticus]SES10345.1 hypothetical protein SAMN04487944_11844 [Gracilibacillus ureilyticus]